MTIPAPQFSSAQDYRELNRRMADAILAEDPSPYADNGYVRRVLLVRGRTSKALHRIPLAVVSINAHRYLVSPTRARNRVINLLADPQCTVASRDDTEPVVAVEVTDPAEVAEVIGLYLSRMNAPWAVSQFPFPADADPARIRANASRVAVFRLGPPVGVGR